MVEDERVGGLPLAEALETVWTVDAHFSPYEPIVLPVEGTDREAVVRGLAHDHEGRPSIYGIAPVRMVAFVGDLDGPDHVATPEWRADTEERIARLGELAPGLAWYATGKGYRVLWTLAEPFEITSEADGRAWSARYLATCEWIENETGLALDRACKDWTRIYRLPRVVRDGKPTAADIHHVGAGALTMPAASAPRASTPARQAPDRDALAGMRKHAAALPPAISGHGGDNALWSAAKELATHGLGEDAIFEVLRDIYNPRCVPPWSEDRLRYYARKCHAEWAALPGKRGAEARAADTDAAWVHPAVNGGKPPAESGSLLGERVSLADANTPIDYVVRALGIAPNDGKVSILGGMFGTSKGPFSNYVAVCVASGRPLFGVHEVRRTNVLILDYESVRTTTKRCHRIALGLGLDGAPKGLHIMKATPERVFDPGWLEELRAYVEANRIGLLFVDSYTRVLLDQGVDFDKPQFAEWATTLAKLSCAVVIIAHATKASDAKAAPSLLDISGSAALASQAQAGVMLRYRSPSDKNRVQVLCARSIEEPFEPFDVVWSGRGEEPLRLAVVTEGEATRPRLTALQAERQAKAQREREAATRAMVEAVGKENHTRRSLESVSGLSRTNHYALVRDLVEEGVLVEEGGYLALGGAPLAVVRFASGK